MSCWLNHVEVLIRDRMGFFVIIDSSDIYLNVGATKRGGTVNSNNLSAGDRRCYYFGVPYSSIDSFTFLHGGVERYVSAKRIRCFDLSKALFENEYKEYLHNENSNVKLSRLLLKNEVGGDSELYLSPYSIDSGDAKKIAKSNLGASFKVCISNNIIKLSMARRQKGGVVKIYSKVRNSIYLKSKGFPVPSVYKTNADVSAVKDFGDCIVKPVAGTGSRGVFLKKNNIFYDIRDKGVYENYVDFEKKYRAYTNRDCIIEEYVSDGSNPTADLKVYCFYGRAHLAREISRLGKEDLHCEYNASGCYINTGRYEKMFSGNAFSKQAIDIAESVSKLIPLPFIRVDLLVSNGIVKVGELTPNPGRYSRFNRYYDHHLGVAYLEAETRLFNDLMGGKKFDIFED